MPLSADQCHQEKHCLQSVASVCQAREFWLPIDGNGNGNGSGSGSGSGNGNGNGNGTASTLTEMQAGTPANALSAKCLVCSKQDTCS